MSAQRWTLSEIREAFVNGGPPDAGYVLAADYERDVAAKEAEIERLRGVNSGLVDDFNSLLVRHSRCDTAVAAAEERGFNDGIGEGWNAALEALPHDRACIVNGRAGAKCNCVRGRAIAALRKPTEAQT